MSSPQHPRQIVGRLARLRRVLWSSRWLHAAPWVATLLALLCLAVLSTQTQASPAPAPTVGATITITDAGFQPADVTIIAGQGITWTNHASQNETVTADSDLFDSGNLVPGAGFSLALAIPGNHTYHSSANAVFTGTLHVVLNALSGPGTDLANTHIPDFFAPPEDPSDFSPHPLFGLLASRTRLIVGFTPTATVDQANAALTVANVSIVGGLPKEHILFVIAPDTPDFSALTAAATSLRSSPAVAFAALDFTQETQIVPRPAENVLRAAPVDWNWSISKSPSDQPDGTGGNWGLEASRFPQAWNLTDAITRKNSLVETAIVDNGFFAHPVLGNMTIERLCRSLPNNVPQCTDLPSQDHGTHVSGIVGATFDNDSAEPGHSLGVSGANPVAVIHSVPWGFAGITGTVISTHEVFDLVLDNKENATWPALVVINFSVGYSWSGAALQGWITSHPMATCGPGYNDDGLAGASQPCTPNNDDKWLAQIADQGKAARAIAERASSLGVVIVPAAGNNGMTFCVPFGSPSCTEPLIRAQVASDFSWADKNWASTLDNPVISVEAIDQAMDRPDFSDVQGDVSAPGVDIWSTASPNLCVPPSPGLPPPSVTASGNPYCSLRGTSMAAPYVTALVGYLAAVNPDLTVKQMRDAILTWSRSDVLNAGSNRIDAFASVMSLPDAAKKLVDVSDSSKDGDQRVILGPGSVISNTSFSGATNPLTGREYETAPDGTIDMRDFRRFRDAWLQYCITSHGADPGCPSDGSVTLNGAPDHPKRDLNFDGCVYVQPGDPGSCVTPENVFPRFDFNGDGMISRSITATVPLKADGSPAASPSEATVMTDLGVMASQWASNGITEPVAIESLTEGWQSSQLDSLMVSGDVEVHADDFFASGADDVMITLRDTATNKTFPARHLHQGDDFLVATVPVGASTSPIEVRASATITGATLFSFASIPAVGVGDDQRVDLCGARLNLAASRMSVPADGKTTDVITATLTGCAGNIVPGKTITFTLAPTGTNQASLAPASGTTSATGIVTTTLTAGTIVGTYVVTATLDLGSGQQATSTITVATVPRLTITYAWRETPLTWGQDYVLSDWCLLHNCTVADHTDFQNADPAVVLTRTGTLTNTESGVLLSELVGSSVITATDAWTTQVRDLAPGAPSDDMGPPYLVNGSSTYTWQVSGDDAQRYQSYALPASVSVDDTPTGVTLNGLQAVGELGYQHVIRGKELSVAPQPPYMSFPVGARVLSHLALVPRGDGSALQYADDVTQPLVFPRLADGTLQPYQFCGTVDQDISTPSGFAHAPRGFMPQWVSVVDDQVPANQVADAVDYGDVDGPFTLLDLDPLGLRGGRTSDPGHLAVQYAFAAVATYGDMTTTVTLPDCAATIPTPTPTSTPSPTPSSTATPTTTPSDTPTVTVQAAGANFSRMPLPPVPAALLFHPVALLVTNDTTIATATPTLVGSFTSTPILTMTPTSTRTATPTRTSSATSTDTSAATFTLTPTPPAIPTPMVQAPRASFASSPQQSGPTALLFPPAAAFVISPAASTAGQSVTFVNVSRDANAQPVSASLNPGDGSPAIVFTPGASHPHIYPSAGTFAALFTATDSGGGQLAAVRSIVVVSPPTATPTVTPTSVPPDFTLTLAPTTLTLPPGGSASFLVSLAALGSFNAPVTLSAIGLPNGVTAQFYPNPVTPSGTSNLVLAAASNATTSASAVQFNVSGSGGGITHTTTSSLTVNFGLVPVCYGAFAGVVTDSQTGLPVPNAAVSAVYSTVHADGAGHYALSGVQLGSNNAPQTWQVTVTGTGYWPAYVWGLAACGQVTPLNIQIAPVATGTASGTVHVGVPDPNDLSRTRKVTATSATIAGATISFRQSGYSGIQTRSAADGTYNTGPLQLNTNNAPTTYLFSASGTGYWFNLSTSATVLANQNTVVDLAIVPQCTGAISGTVLFGDTLQPVPNLKVDATSQDGTASTTTDAAGRYIFSAIGLGYDNSSTQYTLSANASSVPQPNYHSAGASVPLVHCGDSSGANLTLAPIVSNYGTVQGHVYDHETGLPLLGASVYVSSGAAWGNATTDATGAYAILNIFIGQDAQTTGDFRVTESLSGYWDASPQLIQVTANQTTTFDLRPLKRRYADVVGTVRDAVTHQLITGATICADNCYHVTGSDGTYHIGPLPLSVGNQPVPGYRVSASATSYWGQSRTGTLVADQTTTIDIDMIPVCTGATIVGSVVNATNQQSIQGATVSTYAPSYTAATTDANGSYTLRNLTVGNNNSPLQLTVYASAPGFITQSKNVTIFCGATINLDFGRPATAFGTITGTVTNLDTGQPLASTFIGSGYGGSATTDAQGHYTLTNVPLGANNADRTWQITAAPAGFPALTQSVTTSANTTVHLDFGFSAASPTPTGTATPTLSATPTTSPTTTPTSTSTNTPTSTPTNTPTETPTATPTETPSPTFTPTDTSTETPTYTPTDTMTATPSSTATDVPTDTPTETPTTTPTFTPTSTATYIPTNTPTEIPTQTPTSTVTNTPRSTPTAMASPTSTPTDTPTETPTSTPTNTFTATVTETPTPTEMPTDTPTVTPSGTVTPTSGWSPTSSPTATPISSTESQLWAVQYRWGSPAPGYTFAYWPIFKSWKQVRIQNNGPLDAYNVTATLTYMPFNVQSPDNTVSLGNIPVGSSAWSLDNFTTWVDMAHPAPRCEGVRWRIEYDDAQGVHHVLNDVPEFPPGKAPGGC